MHSLELPIVNTFRVVYHGISHEALEFSWYTHESLEYTKKTKMTSGIFPGIPQKALHNYFIPCHDKNSVFNTMNVIYAQRAVGRLGKIPPSIYNGFPLF